MKPLTKEQLRDNAAAILAFADGKPIQFEASAYGASTQLWYDTTDLRHMHDIWHRPKPQPVSRPWSKPEDVPLHCWIRRHNCHWSRLVIMVNEKRISCIDGDCTAIKSLDFSELAEHHEYSTDRKTWHPCTVEDAQ